MRLSYQNKWSESKSSQGRGNAWAILGESPHCLAAQTHLLCAQPDKAGGCPPSVSMLHCIKVWALSLAWWSLWLCSGPSCKRDLENEDLAFIWLKLETRVRGQMANYWIYNIPCNLIHCLNKQTNKNFSKIYINCQCLWNYFEVRGRTYKKNKIKL